MRHTRRHTRSLSLSLSLFQGRRHGFFLFLFRGCASFLMWCLVPYSSMSLGLSFRLARRVFFCGVCVRALFIASQGLRRGDKVEDIGGGRVRVHAHEVVLQNVAVSAVSARHRAATSA